MKITESYINKSSKIIKKKIYINGDHNKIYEFVYTIINRYHKNYHYDIFLTGGNTIHKFYNFLFTKKFKFKWKKVFLTDERITNLYNETNQKKINNSIPNFDFQNFFYKNKIFDKKKINILNKKNFKNYIVLCSLGDDGHLASIFQNNLSFKNYIYTKSRFHKFNRISISSKIFKKSKLTILFALGKKKIKRLKLILDKRKTSKEPFSMLKNFIIISDHDL